MTNEERRNIIDQAKTQGYQGSYVDLFRQAAAHGGADPMFAALSSQDKAEGLAPYHEAGMHNVGMTFPNVGPHEPMNTMRTKVPIDIKKYDDKTGHLVASHLSVPPGMTNVDSGPRRGTVVETPSRMRGGGFTKTSESKGGDNSVRDGFHKAMKLDTRAGMMALDHPEFADMFNKMTPEELEMLAAKKAEITAQAEGIRGKGVGPAIGMFTDLDLSFIKPLRERAGVSKSDLTDWTLDTLGIDGAARSAAKAAAYFKTYQKGGPKEDYNMARAKELGYKRDAEGHLPSVDHETGMLLKSKEHPTVKLEFMSQMLSPERKMIANPTGYFGENQLQYVPRNKKQAGGYNPNEYMNEMQPKVFPNQKRDAKWVKYATDHDFAGRFPGETRTNKEIGLEKSNRNTIPLPPNPVRPKELKRAQEGGPKFAYEGQKTRMSSDITPEQAEMLMANQINMLPEIEIGGEATTPRAKAVAQANQVLGMEGGNQMRDMLEGMEEADRAAGVPMALAMGFAGGAPLLAGAAGSLPAIGESILGTNAAIAQGGARLTQGVNAASSALGRSQAGQLGSRLLANTELGQGFRAAGQGLKFAADKVGQAGQAVNNAFLGSRVGSSLSAAYNTPLNLMSGMRAIDAAKLATTISGIQAVPKVPGYIAEGQLGKAASTLLKVPGLKAAPAMASLSSVKKVSDATEGAKAVANIGSAEDLGDVAAATKMLPGTSQLRVIAEGIDATGINAVRKQEGGPKEEEETSWWGGGLSAVPNFFNPFTAASVFLNEGKRRVAENISPLGYDSPDGDPVERIKTAVWENQPEAGSTAGTRGRQRQPFMQERTDLLNILLGREQEYNSIPKSEYSPTKTSSWFGNDTYYASPTTEQWIRRQIKARGADGFIKGIEKKRDPETGSASHYWHTRQSDNVLGNYIIDVGEDEKGKYVSYYDKWDLNPLSGGKDGVLKMSENAGQAVLGLHPPEIYGRVYLRKGGFLKRPSGI